MPEQDRTPRAERVAGRLCLCVLALAALLLVLVLLWPRPQVAPVTEAEASPTPAAALPTAAPALRAPAPAYDAAAMNGRAELLRLVRSQLGSEGQILAGGEPTGVWYTQWYVGGTYPEGWSEQTPWCGAFVSWAAARAGASMTPFATVSAGAAAFQSGENGSWREPGQMPLPGDLVFFDWESEGEADHGVPDHVGVVLYVDGDELVTVEGNDRGRVEENRRPLDGGDIYGYGVLAWEPEE